MSQVQSWNLILLWPFRLQTKRPQNTVEAILNQTFEEGKSPWVELDDTLVRKEAAKPHLQPARKPKESDPEYTYFHPFVRRLLYDNDRPTFRLLRRRTEGFRYCWVTAGDGTTIARLEVRDILLYVASQQAFNAGSVAIRNWLAAWRGIS